MKKLLLLLLLVCTANAYAQIVTSNPSPATDQGTVEIIYDASLGNGGLKGFTGDVYAHVGLVTSLSTSNADWRYVPAQWGENIPKCKMVSMGNNKWKLSITPDIRTFFGVTSETEKLQQFAFVFRSADGSKTGRGTGGADIFYSITMSGLQVGFDSPIRNYIGKTETPFTVNISASQTSTIKLFQNTVSSAPLASVEGALALSKSLTIAQEGNLALIAEATVGSHVKRDTLSLYIRGNAKEEARPQGLLPGITIGADKRSITLCLYAPRKEYVFVLGSFNDYKLDPAYMMKSDGTLFDRYFWLTIDGLDPNKEYAFQYLVDGTIRMGDPYCEKILDPWNDKYINEKAEIYPNLMPYPHDKSSDVLSVVQTQPAAYQWSVPDFKRLPQDQLMIYEMLLRDFTDEGSVSAAIDKLDYLQSLGVNAIELMPISEFEGNDSWGYNPTFFFASDKAYGTKEDYKRFVDACHSRGMAVIVDVVFNHATGLHPFAKMWWNSTANKTSSENPYFNVDAPHPYSVFHDFNHSRPIVRDYFKRVLKHWLTEYQVDGFRFDLSKGFTQTVSGGDVGKWGQYDAARISYLKEYQQAINEVAPTAYTILEHFADNSEEKELSKEGMMMWGNAHGGYENTAKGSQSSSDISYGLAKVRGWSENNLITYMESHDEERISYSVKTFGTAALKADSASRFKNLAANAAIFFAQPGPKMIWQFGELGYDVSIDYNGRTGRKPILWNYNDMPQRREIYDVYALMMNIRTAEPALFSMEAALNHNLTAMAWNSGKTVTLSHNGKGLAVVSNFTASQINTSVQIPFAGEWTDAVTGEKKIFAAGSQSVQMPAYGFKVFTGGFATSVEENFQDQPLFYYDDQSRSVVVAQSVHADRMEVYSSDGAMVARASNVNRLALPSLPQGVYVGKATINGKVQTRKIVIR